MSESKERVTLVSFKKGLMDSTWFDCDGSTDVWIQVPGWLAAWQSESPQLFSPKAEHSCAMGKTYTYIHVCAYVYSYIYIYIYMYIYNYIYVYA